MAELTKREKLLVEYIKELLRNMGVNEWAINTEIEVLLRDED